MTRDELLEKINFSDSAFKVENALLAVVELLQEFSKDEMLKQYKNSYLLLAFQEAIEKEFK